jgi:PD-(D/E)XK nuclease superfamily protein
MEHPKAVGDRTTLAAMLALYQAGYEVLIPFRENTRYDLVIDDGQTLARVQCKTGRLREGAVRFAVCSSYGHHRNPTTARRDYHGDIDYFCVHCPDTGGAYLVPIDDPPVRRQAPLRVRTADPADDLAPRRTVDPRRELRVMDPDEKSLYADMRAAVRGDQERARRRAEQKRTEEPVPEPPPALAIPEPRPAAGVRRLFGRRRER